MKKINATIEVVAIIFLLVIFIATNFNGNTSKDRHQNPKSEDRLGQMVKVYHEKIDEAYLIKSNIEDYCFHNGVECSFLEDVPEEIDYNKEGYPTGALGKVDDYCYKSGENYGEWICVDEGTDMRGNPIASMYIPGGKPLPPVYGNTVAKRFQNFVRYYANGFDESVFIEARNAYGVKEEVLACAARAETSLGNENKSANNILNYGNTDGGTTRSFEGIRDNVLAAAHGLSQGTYIGGNNILGELSNGGRKELGLPSCQEAQAPNKCYATSEENWHRNMLNCLSWITGEKQTAHYRIKSDLLARR